MNNKLAAWKKILVGRFLFPGNQSTTSNKFPVEKFIVNFMRYVQREKGRKQPFTISIVASPFLNASRKVKTFFKTVDQSLNAKWR